MHTVHTHANTHTHRCMYLQGRFLANPVKPPKSNGDSETRMRAVKKLRRLAQGQELVVTLRPVLDFY